MCECKVIAIGSEECNFKQIELSIPDHMSIYRYKTILDGRKPTICLDPCIANEIKQLWSLGIITYGCCCGHNILPSFVNVDDKDIFTMIELGYVQNHTDLSRKDTFKLKSA